MTFLLKIGFGIWGLVGIIMHILSSINKWNATHAVEGQPKPINTPKQILAYATSDLVGLAYSVGAYIILFGIWMASTKLIGAHPQWEALAAWTNVWNGVTSPVFAFVSDSIFNKMTAKADELAAPAALPQ